MTLPVVAVLLGCPDTATKPGDNEPVPAHSSAVRGATVCRGHRRQSPAAPTTTITFGQYGQTTQSAETDIWLTDGSGSLQRYIMVAVNPVTGLASIENFQGSPPPAAIVTGS